MSPHPAGMASLLAAIEDALGRPRPITVYGCLPFTPARDLPAGDRGPCPICGRRRDRPEPIAPGDPDLICGGCHQGSAVIEAVCHEQLRRDRQRQHLVSHNRQLTAGTPVPAILAEPDPEPAPAPMPPRKARKPKEACPC